MRRESLLSGCLLALVTVVGEASTFTEKWSYPTSGVVYSSPALDGDGNLYFGARDRRVYSLTAHGESRWTSAIFGDWMDSSPALLPDGGLVIGSWDFSVYCLEQETGALRWSYQTEGAVTASPAVGVNGKVYVASTDGTVTSLNPEDGSVNWTYLNENEGDIETSIALDEEGNLYFADSLGTAMSLGRGGALRWATNLADLAYFQATEFEVFGSPALGGDGVVYFGTRGQELFALDTVDGIFLWSHVSDQWIDSAPVLFSDGTVLTVSRDGALKRLSTAGFEIWNRDVGEVLYSSPVVDASDRVFVAGYVGSGQTRVTCLDIDGNVLSTTTLSGINDSSPSIAPDGTLYFGMHDNRLIAFEGAGSGLSPTSIWPRFRQGLSQEGRYTGFDPAVMTYFPSAEASDGGWYKLDWLGSGWLNATYFPWVYHVEHEWFYCSGDGSTDTYWFYDSPIGWVYTSRFWGDVFYYEATNAWLFYLKGTSLLMTEGRWFFDFAAELWFQEDTLYFK